MNPGGEPERDDTGLPPVHIEIPDDARELDRDVHAYHRELRAERRQRRRDRWHTALARDGIVLPMLACCLILALIAGTLLTVFTATGQNLTGPPASGSRSSAPAAGRTGPTSPTQTVGGSPDTVTAQLPDAIITVAGRSPMHVRSLSRAALVLVPPRCGTCGTALAWLAGVAAHARAHTYLIATKDNAAQVDQLYDEIDSQLRATVSLAQESDGRLQVMPEELSAAMLTVILVGRAGQPATYANGLDAADDPTVLVQALTS